MPKKRLIIKIGSSLLTNNGKGLNKTLIADWVAQIVKLKERDIDIILVSSGAIAAGMQSLGWSTRPSDIHQLQAAAAVGQVGLIEAYETLFLKYQIHTAQILLTHENLTNKQRYNNIISTLNNLVNLNVIPIINENDTVATDEIRFGDNDILAAMVANLTKADTLMILTDQDGIFDSDPRQNTAATLISSIHIDDEKLIKVAGKNSGSLGCGGMYSKVLAAKQAAKSGTKTIIASGVEPDILLKLNNGEPFGTIIHC